MYDGLFCTGALLEFVLQLYCRDQSVKPCSGHDDKERYGQLKDEQKHPKRHTVYIGSVGAYNSGDGSGRAGTAE